MTSEHPGRAVDFIDEPPEDPEAAACWPHTYEPSPTLQQDKDRDRARAKILREAAKELAPEDCHECGDHGDEWQAEWVKRLEDEARRIEKPHLRAHVDHPRLAPRPPQDPRLRAAVVDAAPPQVQRARPQGDDR